MSDLFLIAHKVRGEPAFDVAERMTCPVCDHGQMWAEETQEEWECGECDGLGYWWIIPTSGHRAYPFAHWEFYELMVGDSIDGYVGINAVLPEMPSALPDHYPTRHSSSPSLDISTLLAPAVKVKIERRF